MAQAQETAQENVLDEKEQAALVAKQEVDELAKKAKVALDEFEKLNQTQVDRIVAKASIAALNKHLVLAKMAVDVGFVTGVTPATMPTGSAISSIPRTSSSLIMPTVRWPAR